jgi:hypothetical protein
MDEIYIEEEYSEEDVDDVSIKCDYIVSEIHDYCKEYHLPIFNHPNFYNIIKENL